MNETPEQQPQLLTIREAAEALRVCEATLYGMMRRGELVTVKFGRRTLIERQEISRVIAAHRAA
ncbi:helix-turn-helix domain-containing protein [Mycolicibacterium palauense]|uniref:helix-turn-helix domain-containing protein n=1 Tax=Mycolicibacterium palauense TaxID=2034511 RepID=UPI0011457336|nr:helix-turn-helix domain-containing protein [Mycolicibacterium palauense]